MRSARRELRQLQRQEDGVWWKSWVRAWQRLGLGLRLAMGVASFALLQVVSLLLVRWPYDVWSSHTPVDPGSLQTSLWLVVATLVGVTLPVFIVVVQYTGTTSKQLSPVPLAEVLRQKTRIDLALIVAAVAVLHSGIDALWFVGSAVLAFDFFICFVSFVCVLGLSVVILFGLVRSPLALSEAGFSVLLERLDRTIDDSWIVSQANDNLISTLKGSDIAYNPLFVGAADPSWVLVAPPEKGRLRDVNPQQLARVLEQLKVPASAMGTVPTTVNAQADRSPDVFLLRLCNDVIGPASPVLAVSRTSVQADTSDELWRSVARWIECGKSDG